MRDEKVKVFIRGFIMPTRAMPVIIMAWGRQPKNCANINQAYPIAGAMGYYITLLPGLRVIILRFYQRYGLLFYTYTGAIYCCAPEVFSILLFTFIFYNIVFT